MIREEIDWFLKKCCEATKIPKSILEREPTADGELAWMRLERRCEAVLLEINENISEYRKNNNFLNSKDMVRKKKLYLVWQTSGSFAESTYCNRLCGVFDNEEKALELKSKLDLNVVRENDCWTIVPKDIWESWSTVDCDDNEREFDYIDEYKGYDRVGRDLQENRWVLMTRDYSEAVIEEVDMNSEL